MRSTGRPEGVRLDLSRSFTHTGPNQSSFQGSSGMFQSSDSFINVEY